MVDDDATVRTVLQRYLAATGFDVVAAEDGEKAIVQLVSDEVGFDTVLLDLSMPRMGGRACLRALLDLDPALRVVVATGHAEPTEERALIEAGACAVLHKPFRLAIVVQTLREVLDAS